MKCFQERYIGIMSSVKTLYCVCKIAGLVPFSFIVNPKDGFENVYTNRFSKVFKCGFLKCTVLYCLVVGSNRSAAAHHVKTFMGSFPLSMLMALLVILLNLTANQWKFSNLLRELNSIDIVLFKYDGSRTNGWFKVEMGLVLFILIPWLCVDSWPWGHRMGSIGDGTRRVTHYVQFLAIMQFCKLTQFLRYSLKTMNVVLCACVIEERNF